jgi:hypothetical protein
VAGGLGQHRLPSAAVADVASIGVGWIVVASLQMRLATNCQTGVTSARPVVYELVAIVQKR